MKRNTWQVLMLVLGMLMLASCGQQTPTVANPPGSSQLKAQVAVSGLTGTYYDVSDFTGPTLTRVDTAIDFAWGTGAPLAGIQPTTYAVLWTGQIQAPTTEEYTFFVTSGGGARLMVNGKPITNNWGDHAVITDLGKINMVGGQKVDLRLEYYRNTTNPGTIKLEWQSATQAKAVVPSSRFFSSDLNATSAASIIQNNVRFKALGVTLNLSDVWTSVAANGDMVLIAQDSGSGVVNAQIVGGTVRSLLRYNFQSKVYSDLLDGSLLKLGQTSQYYDANNNQTDAQKKLLKRRLISLLDKRVNVKEPSGQITTPSTAIRPLGVISGLGCFDLIPPPPPCNKDECKALAEKYSDALCAYVDVVEIPVTIGVFFEKPQNLKQFWGALYGYIAALADDLNAQRFRYFDAWNAYRLCLKAHPADCLLQISVTPNPINITAKVGDVSSTSVSVKNIGVFAVNTGNPVPIEISHVDFIPSADSKPYFPLFDPNLSLTNLFLGTRVSIYPGDTYPFTLYYACPSTPKVLTGSIGIYHDAGNLPSPVTVPVTIYCYSDNPQLVGPSPNPFRIKAPSGQTASGQLSFKNDGKQNLTVRMYSGVGGNLVILPNETKVLNYSWTCAPPYSNVYVDVPDKVISNDPLKPLVPITIKVACTGLRVKGALLAQGQSTGGSSFRGYIGTNFSSSLVYTQKVVWQSGTGFSGFLASAPVNCSATATAPVTTAKIAAVDQAVTDCSRAVVRSTFAAALVQMSFQVNDSVLREAALGWAGWYRNLHVVDLLNTTGTIAIYGDSVLE
jgi:PA14 domain